MTDEQYQRWKDFALRMARSCFRGQRRPGPRHIVACVWEVFADIESGSCAIDKDDLATIQSWENSGEYPEGNPKRERKRQGTYCNCDGYRHANGGQPNRSCPECRGSGIHNAWKTGPLVCDVVSEYDESWMPRYWNDRNQEAWEWRRDRWCDDARCCIRAGLDMALNDGYGVLGFSAGDMRRMYPTGVPDWIARQWDTGTTIAVVGVTPGVGFVPREDGPCERFEEMPDEAEVWL